MSYKPITNQLISLLSDGEKVKKMFIQAFENKHVSRFTDVEGKTIDHCKKVYLEWRNLLYTTLLNNQLKIEYFILTNLQYSPDQYRNWGDLKVELTELMEHLRCLSKLTFELEQRQSRKTIEFITIDDIDNFQKYLTGIKAADIDEKYISSKFLEQDVKEAFCKALDEKYIEKDSGAEIRDIYTNNLLIGGKRKNTVIMLKGRSVSTPLRLKDCGKNGNQLLKLARNTSAQVFIVQHVNKIDPEINDALKDHILSNSFSQKVWICMINGVDTARLLTGMGKNLEQLANKK